jgi:hypothetical protein
VRILCPFTCDSVTFPESACTQHTDSSGCLSQKSRFGSGHAICQWDVRDKACVYGEPEDDLITQLAIAIASDLLSSPIVLLVTLVFSRMLLPPTRILDVKAQDLVQDLKLAPQYVKDNLGWALEAPAALLHAAEARLNLKQQPPRPWPRPWPWGGRRRVSVGPAPLGPEASEKRLQEMVAAVPDKRRAKAELQLAKARAKAAYEQFITNETGEDLKGAVGTWGSV